MAGYLPLFPDGKAITYQATAPVVGGNVVELTGDRTIAPAGADSAKVVGVASNDAAAGDDVTVYARGVQRPLADGAITAGARVVAAAGGLVAAADEESTNPIGLALAAAANGEPVQVRFDA